MLNRLIAVAVERRVATLALTVAFVVFGVQTFSRRKVEAFPDVTNVQVMVITLYPGQAAEEVERKVSIPVERALTGVPLCTFTIVASMSLGPVSHPAPRTTNSESPCFT